MYIIEISFYITLPVTSVISIITILLNFEKSPFLKELIVPDEMTREIDTKFQIAFRFLASLIMMFPALLNFDEYFLIVFNGAAIAPFITYLYPIVCYNYYYRNKKRKLKIIIFNYVLLVFAIGTNFWSVFGEIQKE